MHAQIRRTRFKWLLRHYTTYTIILASLASALLLSSCSGVGRYAPEPSLAEGVTGRIPYTGTISIVNAQDSTIEHDLGFRGIKIDYHEFTQSVVDALKSEFESSGATIQDEADKTLRVSVRKVTMMPGAVYRGGINARVETGDGDTAAFYATRASYASGWNVGTAPTKPLNAAFVDLVKSIPEDETVRGYLEN